MCFFNLQPVLLAALIEITNCWAQVAARIMQRLFHRRRCAMPGDVVFVLWQGADGTFDDLAKVAEKLTQLRVRHLIGHWIVAGRRNPLTMHHLHPTRFTKEVINIAAKAAGRCEQFQFVR